MSQLRQLGLDEAVLDHLCTEDGTIPEWPSPEVTTRLEAL